MKNLILIILVAIVPFSTIAQKKSKKSKKDKTEKIVDSSASYEFMIITGYEVAFEKDVRAGVNRAVNADTRVKEMMKSNSRILINFDFGRVKANSISRLGDAENFRTMAAAVNAAANEGWDFVSSNIVLSGSSKIHYYYMKRNK